MIEIVQAEEKHIPQIKDLFSEFSLFHGNVEPAFMPADNAWEHFEDNILRKRMASEEGLVMAALDGDRVVGFSVSEIEKPFPGLKQDKYGHIGFMAVTADYRRMGIAQQMAEKAIEWFRSMNLNRAEMDIVTNNKTAASFWRNQGFVTYTERLYKDI